MFRSALRKTVTLLFFPFRTMHGYAKHISEERNRADSPTLNGTLILILELTSKQARAAPSVRTSGRAMARRRPTSRTPPFRPPPSPSPSSFDSRAERLTCRAAAALSEDLKAGATSSSSSSRSAGSSKRRTPASSGEVRNDFSWAKGCCRRVGVAWRGRCGSRVRWKTSSSRGRGSV